MFDGTLESWWNFSQVFKEMLKIRILGPVLEMAQLSRKLPEKAKRLITGVKEPTESWRLLEERCGDIVLSVMHKLETVMLPQGPQHDKIEALVLAVRTAKMCLKAAGDEHQLFLDYFTLGNGTI